MILSFCEGFILTLTLWLLFWWTTSCPNDLALKIPTEDTITFKVAYYSFSETQLRLLRNSMTPFFLRACNTLRHHREKAENTSEIWLVEIAFGALLTFRIMNGWSLEAVSELYRYKISCKTLTKTSRSCCENSHVYHVRHIALFQRAFKLHACSVLLTKEVAKNCKSTFWPQSTRKLTV